MKINKTFKNIILTAFCFVFIAAQPAKASDSSVSDETEEAIYQDATYENFAKTYWRFRKFDISDNAMVDKFMFINECDLYREYAHNEFEWAGIREATREHISNSKEKFPANYKFVQPISLGEYDFDKKGFFIAEEYALKGVKRFEISSDKHRTEVCGTDREIPGYPRVIALELTRPMVFDFFEVEPDLAQEIITKKMKSYEDLRAEYKSREERLSAREVFMVAKVKMFAYKPDDLLSQQGHKIAPMLGILEQIEIYSDRKLTQLMYKKDFKRQKRSKQKEF